MSHCCEQMVLQLKNERVPINYSPRFREYSILLTNSSALQIIDYCPWCGAKLPVSLRDLWFEKLEQLIGESIYDIAFDKTRLQEIPESYRDDGWWK